MSVELLAYLIIGAAAGGFISGLSGFGTALFALGWWLQVMPPQQAVAVILALSVVSSFQGAIAVRSVVNWSLLARYLIPAMLGIPLGVLVLNHIGTTELRLILGVVLVVFAGFMALRTNLPKVEEPGLTIDMAIGFFGGVMSGIAGLSGILLTMWLTLHDHSKERSRALLQPYNFAVLGASAFVLAAGGAYTKTTLLMVALAVPVTFRWFRWDCAYTHASTKISFGGCLL